MRAVLLLLLVVLIAAAHAQPAADEPAMKKGGFKFKPPKQKDGPDLAKMPNPKTAADRPKGKGKGGGEGPPPMRKGKGKGGKGKGKEGFKRKPRRKMSDEEI